MYLFTSAVFFLVFFSVQDFHADFFGDEDRFLTQAERYEAASRLFAQQDPIDSLEHRKLALLLDTTLSLQITKLRDTAARDSSQLIQVGQTMYVMKPQQDKGLILQDTSLVEMDWVAQSFDAKWKKYKKQYGDDINQMMGVFIDRFVHWFPYILFVSLPLFALMLKLLYVRHKSFFYSDHAVFTLYHYIFSFILLLLIMACNYLKDASGWGLFNTIINVLLISWFVYLFLSLKRFYGQGFGKTLGKFVLLNILGLLSFALINALFLVFFIYQL